MRGLLLLISLVVIFSVAFGKNCFGRHQCNDVSTNQDFVQCVGGKCQCRDELGFSGSATTDDKCRCIAAAGDNATSYSAHAHHTHHHTSGETEVEVATDGPGGGKVIWHHGTPYCISKLRACAENDEEVEKTKLYETKVRKIYENLIPPTPTEILAGNISVNDIFSEVAAGRIDPVGTFDDTKHLVEYYYGLAAQPNNYVTSVDFVDLFGQGKEVFVRVNLLFAFTDPKQGSNFNITQSGRYIFGDDDRVVTTDLIIHNLGQALNTPDQLHDPMIQYFCSVLMVSPGNCKNPAYDPDGHYTDVNDCISFFRTLPFGTWDQAASNTVVCRQLHTYLTIYDPETHCMHAGKTGGGKCVDTPYYWYYNITY